MPPGLVQRVATLADEPVVFDPADRQRELTESTWSISASSKERETTSASEVAAAVRVVLEAWRRRAAEASVERPTTFAVWPDAQTGQLRLSVRSCAPTQLPLDSDIRLSTLDAVAWDWLGAGGGGSVLSVFAARLERTSLDAQHRWWKHRGGQEMRELLLTLWDPIGVFGAEEAQDEYDSYGGVLARLLAEGADKGELAAALAAARTRMGLDPDEADAWAAEHLLAWYPRSARREPLDAAVSWSTSDVVVVRTEAELDALLDELDERYAREPLRASIEHDSGAILNIGLGREVSVLDFTGPAPEWPPYLVSRGDLTPADEEVDWTYCEHHTPSLRGELVPLDAAREAARVFFSSGRLTRAVRWEHV